MVLPRSIHTQSYNGGKDGSPTKAYLMSQRTKCDFFLNFYLHNFTIFFYIIYFFYMQFVIKFIFFFLYICALLFFLSMFIFLTAL